MSLVVDQHQPLRLGWFDLQPVLGREQAVRVETDIGPIWLHANKAMTPWITHFGAWEPDERALLLSLLRPGMNVLDIGANVGYHSLVCARAVAPSGRVVAIEPDLENCALLAANLWDAGSTNVELVRAAAGQATGTTPLTLDEDNRGNHRAFALASAARVIDVLCVRVDDLLRSEILIDVVKIDVQGTDHLVVLGMEETIRQYWPVLIVEFWPGGIAEYGDRPLDVIAYYRDLELSIDLLQTPGIDYRSRGDAALVDAAAAPPGGFGTLILKPST